MRTTVGGLFPSGEGGILCGRVLAVPWGGVDGGGVAVPSWSFIG